MGGTGVEHAGTAGGIGGGKDEDVKHDLFINASDHALMMIAAEEFGAPIEVVMSLALTWGCQRLRDTCPHDLPPEAMAPLVVADTVARGSC